MGILGATGSGKSTIASLLLRMYEPNSGEILIDNTNLNDVNLTEYKNSIGYVPQDVYLFSDSIKNNIQFGKADASEPEIEDAAKNAQVLDNINNFADKFETLLGERGITLSGGQKQRVALARAFIKNPEIFLLDDCLSAVDTETETKILDNLKKIIEEKTAIIISHRVSSLRIADKIIVIDDGCIIETGTHQELMTQNGIYATAFFKQQTEQILEK